ncbi:MAG: hypothetical protein ACFNKL_01035 [Treponema sp.]
MKSGIKIAVSLIITTVLFAAVTIASSFGLFSSIEKTFYEPAKLKIIRAKLDATADYSNEYIDNLLSYFGESDGGFMADPAVLAFTEKSTPDSAIASVYKLMENVPALSGIRIIGSEGRRVYYSYFKTDSRTDGQRKNYADYNSLRTQSGRAEISYPLINAAQNSNNKDSSPIIFFDDIDQRILFSYRLKSEENAFSVIFYVNPLDFKLYLVTKKLIAINENIRLAASDNGSLGGFIYGLPEIGANMLIPSIIKNWSEKSPGPDELVALKNSGGATSQDDSSWSLISSYKGKYAAAAGIYPANILSLPHYVRILLFICTFITACLIVLIIFSLRKDDDVVIRNTIKRFQFELLNDFFEKDMERQQIAGMLEAQKDGLSAKIKKSLGARGKKYGKELDLMLERSWSDIISALSGGKAYSVQPIKPDIDMTEIRRMFEELLQGANLHSAPAPAKDVSAKTVTFSNSSADDVEELEDAEPVEDFDDVEELDEVEPVEDADDVEELEEVEPLVDAGKTEDAQELENADDVEDIEELEEIGADSPEENTGNDDKADALKTLEDENDVKTDNAESFENEKLHEDVELVEDSKVPENADTTGDLEEIAPENTDSDNKAENTVALEHNIDCTEEFLQEDTENLAQETKAKSAVEDSELREEAKFGMPEQLNKNENEITDNSVSDNFLVVAPIEFLTRQDLDQPLNQEQTEEIIPEEHSDNPETLDYIDSADSENNDFSAVEPLESDKSSAPFSFTSFASNTVNVPLLTPEVIIQGDDGVFTISEDISGDNSGNVNKELKNLVDNVLSRH